MNKIEGQKTEKPKKGTFVQAPYLQKGERLGEVDWDGYFGEVFSDAIFHNAPQVDGPVRPVRHPQSPLPRRTTGYGGLGHWLQF